MSKNTKITKKPSDISTQIMSQVKQDQIKMKPRWYFITGSVAMILSLIGLSIASVFLTNIIFFLLKKHGPMGQYRLEMLLSAFPWWIPVVAALLLIIAIILLRKYDFSYKKNFRLIIVGFIISILISAWAVDYFGLNEIWSKGRMRRFYQKLDFDSDTVLPYKQDRGKQMFKAN